ncbi:MAG: ABC transporter substrate-binding protein [Dehalococcoidia bacterium]|nr:ABC transporter substrate-binding protein [Dehalococcoidia bacterium]
MKNKKWAWFLIAIILVISLILASCGQAQETGQQGTTVSGKVTEKTTAPTAPASPASPTAKAPATASPDVPKYGGVMNVLSANIQTWDPIGPSANQLNWYAETLLIGDWYVRKADWDYSSLYVANKYRTGSLAESWEVIDPQTYIFKLRKGVRFHNKPPVNGREHVADDVKWFYEAFFASPTTAKGIVAEFLDKIEVVDKYTVRFRLKKPNTSDFIYSIGDGPQMGSAWPREVIDKFGQDGFKDWRNSITTGPWMVKDYVDGSSITLARNPDYWQFDKLHPGNRLPYMDTVKLLIITDAATRLSALRTHKVDMAAGVSWDQAVSLQQTNPELKYSSTLGNPGLLAMHTKKAPFTDVRVRQALNMAIDYEAIVKDYYKGNAMNAYKTWPMMATWTDSAIKVEEWPQIVRDQFEYKPDKAKKLLTEAGFPNGFKTKVECTKEMVEGMTIIQKYLAAVGVDMEIVALEAGAFSAKKYAHSYDQMLPWSFGTVQAFQSGPAAALTIVYRYPALYNYPDFDDKYFNTELDKALLIDNEVARIKRLKELAAYVMEQAPYILPPAPYFYTFWSPWVKGSHPDGYWGQQTPKFQFYGPISLHLWIDQDLKFNMIGKR